MCRDLWHLGPQRERVTASILILIAGPLWSNPRSQKEAHALTRAGHEVKISGIWFDQAGADRDALLSSGKPWHFEPLLDLRPTTPGGRVRNFLARLEGRLAREAYVRFGKRSPALFGYGARQMLRAAIRARADLTILRAEAGMWAANSLLDLGQRVGVDFEDWYSEDMQRASRARRPIGWLRDLERRAASDCLYCVAASRAMANAIASEYGVRPPHVVYNAFPLAESDGIDGRRIDRTSAGVPSLHWFSQTVGPDRGLELLFAAAEAIALPFEIHLRGRLFGSYAGWIESVIPAGLRRRVFIHDTVPNAELLSRIAEHDIGLALETPSIRSRDLTVTNKVFQYMQAGLAIVATDTAGQREIFSLAPNIGLLIKGDDKDALARAITDLLSDSAKLGNAKRAAADAFREKFCWERQSTAVVELVDRALSAQCR